MCESTPVSINSVWCVVAPDTAINLVNDSDLLLILVIGCRSRVDLPTSVQSGSWELDRSKHLSFCPEIRGD